MEPEGLLPHSQAPAICLYLEPDQSSPFLPHPIFLKIHFNIILPSTHRSSKWSLYFKSPHQNVLCTSIISHTLPHAPPILFFLFLSPKYYLVSSTDRKAPCYVVFSTLLLRLPSYFPFLNTLSLCSSLSVRETGFHTHTEQPFICLIRQILGKGRR